MVNEKWLKTGTLDNGLDVWAQEYKMSEVRYLKIEYRDSEGNRVGKAEDYPVNQIRLLNAVLDSMDMEFGIR